MWRCRLSRRNIPPQMYYGTLRLLEAIRFLGLEKKTRFYHSLPLPELRRLAQKFREKEYHAVLPAFPYARETVRSRITVNYRGPGITRQRHSGLTTSPRVVAKPSSPVRSPAPSPISPSLSPACGLGNMDCCATKVMRKITCGMQWMMLQQCMPEVASPPAQALARQFVELAAAQSGINCALKCEGINEKGMPVVSVTGHDAPGGNR